MVSVIIPVYNSIQSLEHCVHAIRQQTVSCWELILVDDGSTDGSGPLCDRLAAEDARIRVIHKQNGGVSSARNSGIDVAQDTYLTFCDSDDYYESDYLETMLRTAREHPDCGHIWCCFRTVSGYQKENAKPNCTSEKTLLRFALQDYMSLHELWLDASPCNKLFRQEVIKRQKIRFPEDLSLGEDWLFNMDYIDASGSERIAVITKPLYNYYRGNEESLDSRYRSDLHEIYKRLLTACSEYLQKWNVPSEQWDMFNNTRFYMNEKVLRNTMRAPEKSRREKIKWNSSFMKSEEFQDILNKRTCYMHPLFLAAYRSGNYSKVLCVERLSRLRRLWERN